MQQLHVHSSIDENFNKLQALQSAVSFGMILLQSQKTIVSRGKLDLYKAHSTPKACFFMRNIRTSQELADFVLFNLIILSMVGRNRQPLAVGCLPCMAVFHPVTSYRPTVESLAVVSENLYKETTQMYQFIFAAIRRTDLTNHIVKIRINADTEQEARKPLAREFVLVLAGRINLRATKNLVNDTFNQGLSANKNACSIVGTTTKNGNRTRKTCGFFTSQIPIMQSPENLGDSAYIEFAARLRDRTKALSTNKIRRFFAVVDTLSHPTGDISQNTKQRDPTMKIYPQNNRTLATFPALSVSAEMEVVHG